MTTISLTITTEHEPAPSDASIEEDGNATGQQQIESLEMGEEASNSDHEYPTGAKLAFVVMACGLALVVTGLDNSILSTAVPSITNEFKTIADVGWYYSAYRLCSCAFQFMFGKLYTVYPIKNVFLAALVIFEVGSLIAGLAQTSHIFVLGRAISGFGSAGVQSGIFTLIRFSVPLHKRSMLASAAAGLEGVAETIAPVLGGVITDRFSWRWCFLINPPLGCLTVASILFFFENPRTRTGPMLSLTAKLDKIDIVGTGIFVPATTALLLALQWGGTTYGWANARIIVLFFLCGALISLFAWHQYRRKDKATLPFRIVGNRSILSGMIFALCNSSAFNIVIYYMPIYFQSVKEQTATQSGVLILPMVISQPLALCLAGPTTYWMGYYVPLMILTSLVTPIASGLLTTLQVDSSLAKLIAYQVLLGLGNGIGWQGPQLAAQTIMTDADAAMGIACILFAQHLGPALFVSIAQTIFSERLAADLGRLAPELLPSGKGHKASLPSMGLSDLKDYLGPKNLEKALLGYDKAVTQTFYLPLALTCMTVVGTAAMEWRSVKKKQS